VALAASGAFGSPGYSRPLSLTQMSVPSAAYSAAVKLSILAVSEPELVTLPVTTVSVDPLLGGPMLVALRCASGNVRCASARAPTCSAYWNWTFAHWLGLSDISVTHTPV